eukprot:scaffold19.g1861.t1
MACAMAFTSVQTRPGAFRGTQIAARQPAARPAAAPFVVRAAAVESKAAAFARHESDCGSPEVQVAALSARVQQLTAHLQQHRKDYSTRRGLMRILSQRKQLLIYLQASSTRRRWVCFAGASTGWTGLRTDRQKYEDVIAALGIRALK